MKWQLPSGKKATKKKQPIRLPKKIILGNKKSEK
jgi:hypothetical protein